MLRLLWKISILLASFFMVSAVSVWAGESTQPAVKVTPPSIASSLKPEASKIWQARVGEGFRAGTQVLGLDAGVLYGMLMFGGHERHHLALGILSYGQMIGGVQGADHWYGGNWELRGELFGGRQFNSVQSSVIGIAPHLRYNFMTGTRWIPFIDIGAGVSWTDISAPDLGGSFQFNLQTGLGLNWFVKDDWAVSLECRYLHLSSSAISMPNNGVNTLGGIIGLNWFF